MTRLTLKRLRQEAYRNWEGVALLGEIYSGSDQTELYTPETAAADDKRPWTNEVFKTEVRQRFGDLRRRSTWEQAAIAFDAQLIVQGYFEAYEIVAQIASPTYYRGIIRETYPAQVAECALQWPGITEVIKAGLEDIFGNPVYREEQELVRKGLRGFTGVTGQLQALAGVAPGRRLVD